MAKVFKIAAIHTATAADARQQFNRTNILTSTPNITVEMAPPMNPSQVFFGDNLMSGVRPKKKPNMYAIMSLQMIIDTGTRNLNKQADNYYGSNTDTIR